MLQTTLAGVNKSSGDEERDHSWFKNYYINLILPMANDHEQNYFFGVISIIVGLKLLHC